MHQKETFKKLFAVLAVVLMVLPFLVTFSAILTNMFEKLGWYVWLQERIVPFEAKLLAFLLTLVNINVKIIAGSHVVIWLQKEGGHFWSATLAWNCLGWQSLIFLSVSLIFGLRGKYKLFSKLEVVILGIVGTFLVNLFRMFLITVLIYYANEVAVMVMHDYLAVFMSLAWMIFLWWFAYSFVLEERQAQDERKVINV